MRPIGSPHTSSPVRSQDIAQEPDGNMPSHLFVLQRHFIIPVLKNKTKKQKKKTEKSYFAQGHSALS